MRNIFIALYLFLVLFCANFASANEINAISWQEKNCAIFSCKFSENDIINNKDNNFSIDAISRCSSFSLNRTNNNSNSNTNHTGLISSQKKSLEEYIYHQSYLATKHKTALLPFLAQIQPNAP